MEAGAVLGVSVAIGSSAVVENRWRCRRLCKMFHKGMLLSVGGMSLDLLFSFFLSILLEETTPDSLRLLLTRHYTGEVATLDNGDDS